MRPKDGFFLRAESFYNVASYIDKIDSEFSFGGPVIDSYGGVSLHEQSHGESFLALAKNRFGGNGGEEFYGITADGFFSMCRPHLTNAI